MPRRRELLKAGAVAVALGTAGCNRSGTDGSGSDDPETEGNSGDPETDGSGPSGESNDDGEGSDGDEGESDDNEDGSDGDGSEENENIEGWPSFQRTARNDGHATGLSLSAEPTERFHVSLPAGIEHQPVVSGDRLYVHLADGTLCARDVATGEPVWSESLDGQGRTPCVVGDEVVAATDAGIEGFDRTTGDSTWQVELAGVSTAPTPADGRIYAGTDDGAVVVVDPTEPTVTARIDVGGSVATAPAVIDGSLFVGTVNREQGSEIVGIDANSEIDWREDVFGPEAVVLTGSRVISVNRGGFTLYTDAGGQRGGGTASAVAPVDDRAIYTGSEVVTPLPRRRSGTGWTFWPEDPDRYAEVVAPMSVCADTLCVPWGYDDDGDWRRKLLGLDVETGEKRWERQLPGEPTGTVLADGAAFVGTADGDLIAFE